METKLNVTKGVSLIKVMPNTFLNDEHGCSIAEFTREDDALLALDAFNTYNTTGYTPSELKQRCDDFEKRWGDAVVDLTDAIGELKEQKKELVEAATKLAEIQRWVQDNTQRGCENLSALENLEAVLLKHSKDV